MSTNTLAVTLTPESIERARQELISRVISAVDTETAELFAMTQAVVPVISGALKSSGTVSPAKLDPSTGVISSSVSYNTPYAARVHELPTGQHPKYLEGPLAEHATGIMQRIAAKARL